jgi:neutral ceramidase
MISIGSGKADITAFKRGVGMLGYALPTHIMLDVETPLFARAYIFEQGDIKVCVVVCELAFITPALKKGVLDKIKAETPEFKYNDSNLLITAQHTHCSPSGYSFHGLYNMSCPGFIPEIYNKLVNGITSAIVDAEKVKYKSAIYLGKDKFEDDIPVSFNRTVEAYNQNPEVKKYTFATRNLAVDREMTLMHFVNEHGDAIGSINWFAVHTTNLPNNYLKLCSDNKGFAANYLENELHKKSRKFVGAFAQGACGDVSARVKYNPKLPFQRGKYEGLYADDMKSSKFNGQMQYEKASSIINNLQDVDYSKGELDHVIKYVDFSAVDISKAFSNGVEGAVTSPSAMGVGFIRGSIMDGPGTPAIIGNAAKLMARSVKVVELFKSKGKVDADSVAIHRKYKAQGKKDIVIETGARKILGNSDVKNLILPDITDELVRAIKHFHRVGGLDTHAWTPQILPLQIIRIGSIALCALPFEITTVASWRLRKTIEDVLLPSGKISQVILCPYSNAYNGYITTFEEYQVQDYEGGHCAFGQWALSALQQEMHHLASQLLLSAEDRDLGSTRPHEYHISDVKKMLAYENIFYTRVRKKEERLAKNVSKIETRIDAKRKSY